MKVHLGERYPELAPELVHGIHCRNDSYSILLFCL